MPARKVRGAAARSANPRLAARLPGGTACLGREAPMWKRSEVEQLTGLSRHTIQDLCNKNTSRDGLGFWEPAVIKPGYSRFDEGDLLAFYLVRQLTKAGFRPAEVEPLVLAMTEKSDEFASALRTRGRALVARRDEIDARLAALERLEDAAESAPEERLYAVMASELTTSANRALDVADSEIGASETARSHVWTWFVGVVQGLVSIVRGEAADLTLGDIEVHLVCEANGEGASEERRLLARALARFLDEAENGVPIELAFGKGAFSRLRRVASACSLGPSGEAKRNG